jgi:hypothetical protein
MTVCNTRSVLLRQSLCNNNSYYKMYMCEEGSTFKRPFPTCVVCLSGHIHPLFVKFLVSEVSVRLW